VNEAGHANGLARFARFAYAPNALGYCGPENDRALLELGAHAGVASDADAIRMRELVRRFEGAWPYLELIAAANGMADPLDDRVVEAYWIGNPLIEQVDPRAFGAHGEARPHHQYHVFVTYPWVSLLRGDHAPIALDVLDRCRVRWGEVVAVTPGEAIVRSQPLEWDGRALALGTARDETAVTALDGLGFVTDLVVGDWVALHWEWVCEKLTPTGLRSLRRLTTIHLDLANYATAADQVAPRDA